MNLGLKLLSYGELFLTNCFQRYLKIIKLQLHQNASWWLGHSDQASTGNWVLNSTGSKMNYTNWNSGEPNGGIASNCVRMIISGGPVSGFWDDTDCKLSKRAMCEKAVQTQPKGIQLI